MMQRSLAAMASSRGRSSGLMSRQSFSWYSAPQISSTLIVWSPSATWRMSMVAPQRVYDLLDLHLTKFVCRFFGGKSSQTGSDAPTYASFVT